MSEKSQISLEDIFQLIKEVKNDLSGEIENINRDVKSLTNKIDEQYEAVKNRVEELEGENIYLKSKLEEVERQLKSNNLIFYGIKNSKEETQSSLINSITETIKDCMGLEFNKSDVNNCYRIGKKDLSDRPVLLNITSRIKQREILHSGKKLKGANIYVREDLIERDRQERKILVNNLKLARNNNNKAVIRGNKLYINNQLYSVEDLKNETLVIKENSVKQVNSESSIVDSQGSEKEEEESEGKNIANKKEAELQKEQDINKKKKKTIVQKVSADHTPKRNQPARSTTQQKIGT